MLNNPFSYVKRATRTAWRKILHSVACILLVAALAFGGVMAVSPTARAWVQEVFTQWLETRARFVFMENPNAGAETGEWKTEYLPEGFRLDKETNLRMTTKLTYINDEGTKLFLFYGPTAMTGIFGVDNEHQEYTIVNVNQNSAYLFSASNPGERNNLIWIDTENGVAFKLMSNINTEELIRIAENVEKVK